MAKDKELAASEKSEKDKEKKAAKSKDSSKKTGGISKWFKDLKLELKKVVWPDKKTVINNSIVVFAAMIAFAAYTFLLDKGFLWLFQFAISGKK